MTELLLNLLYETKETLSTPLRSLLWWQLTSCIGLTIIITQSDLFKPIRNWLKFDFLECPLCMGFWCGVFIYFFDSGLIIFALNSSLFSFLTWSIYKKYLL